MHQTHYIHITMHENNDLALHRIDTNLLVTLDVLLAERNVTQAGKLLGLSQSAMSHRLRRLRELFEDPLLVPGAGNLLLLTPRASRLEAPLRHALCEVRRLFAPPGEFEPGMSTRSFALRMPDVAELMLGPEMLSLAATEAPKVRFDFLPWSNDLDALENGRVDLQLGAGPKPKHAWVDSADLGLANYQCVVHRDCRYRGKKLSMAQYLKLDHIIVGTKDEALSLVDIALQKQGVQRHVAFRVSNFISAPIFVAQSPSSVATMLVVPAMPIWRLLPLRLMRPPVLHAPFALTMMWHKQHEADAAQLWLRSFIAKIARQKLTHQARASLPQSQKQSRANRTRK